MKTEAKYLGMDTCPGEGVMKEEKFPHDKKPSHRHVNGELWTLPPQKKKKKTPIDYMPNCNYQQRRGTNANVCEQPVGAGSRGTGYIVCPYGKDWAWMPWGQSEGANVT